MTVTLEPHGDAQTHMTIEHAALPAPFADDHERGWTLIAGQLDRRVSTR